MWLIKHRDLWSKGTGGSNNKLNKTILITNNISNENIKRNTIQGINP